jgi:large subunit ribosomal protein L3
MVDTVFGLKKETIQRFTQGGKRVPVTKIKPFQPKVARIKTLEKDGYNALVVSVGKYLRELKINEEESAKFKVGDEINFGEVLHPGDQLIVRGISKGKGFAGVVKRWGFAGGPKTHGQSDRQRAPGSIGMRTTPGRVFKGKKMAGRMGGQQIAIKGLLTMETDGEKGELLVKGVVPGARNSFLEITKIGQLEKFVPLLKVDERETGGLGLSKGPQVKIKEVKEEGKEENKTAEGEKKDANN